MLIATLTLLAFIPYVTLQMRGAGVVIEAVTEGHVPIWVGSAVAYGIVTIYVLFSGVTAVGLTQHVPGPVYADCCMVAGAVPAHQPLWRGRGYVYPHYGRTTGIAIVARLNRKRGAMVMGWVLQRHHRICCWANDVATPVYEGFYRPHRQNTETDCCFVPNVPTVSYPRVSDWVCGGAVPRAAAIV